MLHTVSFHSNCRGGHLFLFYLSLLHAWGEGCLCATSMHLGVGEGNTSILVAVKTPNAALQKQLYDLIVAQIKQIA